MSPQYVSLSVPEDLYPDFLELLLSRMSRGEERTELRSTIPPEYRTVEAHEPAVGETLAEARLQSSTIQKEKERDAIARVYRRVTDQGSAVLRVLRPDSELDVKGIEKEAEIPNAGAALQSIAIQLQKEPLFPKVDDLLEIRKKDGIRLYSINRERAAIIAEIVAELDQ